MSLALIIENCKANIARNPLHHLERKYRNELFRSINDTEVSLRVLLNTAFKVFELFNREYAGDKRVYDFIEQLKQHVNGKMESEVLLSNTKSLHTYIDNFLADGKYNATYAGYSLVFCGYEIAKKQFIYTNLDEFDDEPDNWSSCFYASLAYTNGSSDLAEIDTQKNEEFWYWFLGEGITISQKLEFLTINTEVIHIEAKIIPQRQQIASIKNNAEINILIQQLDDFFKVLNNKEGWVEFKFDGYYVSNNRSLVGYYKVSPDLEFQKLDNTRFYFLAKQFNLLKVLTDLRDKMYSLFPQEGAWYQIIADFSINNPARYHFIYDEKAVFFDNWVDKAAFADDFATYKRADEYTPLWLEAIVKS